MNLEGYTAGAGRPTSELAVEDRWMLSRLATVTGERHDGARRAITSPTRPACCTTLPGTSSAASTSRWSRAGCKIPRPRPAAQRVLAHTLDTLLRLLHPMIPFITEEIWQLLGEAAPRRGLSALEPAAESVMIAPWPKLDAAADRRADRSPLRPVPGSARAACARCAAGRTFRPRRRCEFSVRCDQPSGRTACSPMAALFRVDGRCPGNRLGART